MGVSLEILRVWGFWPLAMVLELRGDIRGAVYATKGSLECVVRPLPSMRSVPSQPQFTLQGP